VLGVAYGEPRRFDPDAVELLRAVAHDTALPLAEHLEEQGSLAAALPDLLVEPGRTRWFHATVDHLPIAMVLLEPVVVDDRLVDCTIVHHNARAAAHLDDPIAALGQRVSQLDPWLADSPLWSAIEQAWRDGRAVTLPDLRLDAAQGRGPLVLSDVSITRLGGLLVVGVRHIDAAIEDPRGA
jgi:hypothetical protein